MAFEGRKILEWGQRPWGIRGNTANPGYLPAPSLGSLVATPQFGAPGAAPTAVMPAMPAPTFRDAATPERGFSLGGLLRGTGDRIEGAADWLTDPKQGQLRQQLLFGALGAGADIYGAYKQGQLEREERRRRRARGAAVAPGYGALLRELAAQNQQNEGG